MGYKFSLHHSHKVDQKHEHLPLIVTHDLTCEYIDCITERNLPLTPSLNNLCYKHNLWTKSNVLRKSTKRQYNLFLPASVLFTYLYVQNLQKRKINIYINIILSNKMYINVFLCCHRLMALSVISFCSVLFCSDSKKCQYCISSPNTKTKTKLRSEINP